MEVTATNFIERLFSVFVVLAGLIVFSFFLGSINQALSHLRSRSAQETYQNLLVRRYISDKQISINLAADVFAFIRQRGLGRARSKVVFGDMKALDGLPRSLLMNLQIEVGLPILETHPLLKHLTVLGNNEISRLCEKALKEAGRIYGEDLFHAGASGEKMYFIQSGRLNYASEQHPDVIEEVKKGNRCSEASVWLTWEHHGQMTCADHNCHFFQLDGAGFRKIMIRSEHAELCSMYARLFLRKLIEEYITEEDASDLFGSDAEVGSIMTPIRAVIRTSNLMGDFGGMSLAWAFQEWRDWHQERKEERKNARNAGPLQRLCACCRVTHDV